MPAPSRAAERAVVVLSNRGPLTFARAADGTLVSRRGAGGLVSGIGPLVAGTGATWIAAAISEGDREAAREGIVEAQGLRVRSLAFDQSDYRMAYDVVCNETLWYLYHGLFDLARRPRIDHRWREAWTAYRRMNEAFADAAAEVAPQGAAVLVQDYHLSLVGARLAKARPDVRAVHFSHTPFATPELLRVVPDDVARELVEGLAAYHACGFHTRRWADGFVACCRDLGVAVPATFVASLAPDLDDIEGVAASPAATEAGAELAHAIGDRRLLVRVDRVELSKNLLRGFHAYDDLLTRYPEWQERVVFAASVYPSREGLADYLAYRQEVEGLVRRLNDKWGTPGWVPVLLEVSDDFPRSVAALVRADVLLVNPIRDGLNLVAKEAVLVNRHDAVVVLSREAGVWEELGAAGVVPVNPYDVSGTADALHEALSMDVAERRSRADRLRAAVVARRPADWLAAQLDAAG